MRVCVCFLKVHYKTSLHPYSKNISMMMKKKASLSLPFQFCLLIKCNPIFCPDAVSYKHHIESGVGGILIGFSECLSTNQFQIDFHGERITQLTRAHLYIYTICHFAYLFDNFVKKKKIIIVFIENLIKCE